MTHIALQAYLVTSMDSIESLFMNLLISTNNPFLSGRQHINDVHLMLFDHPFPYNGIAKMGIKNFQEFLFVKLEDTTTYLVYAIRGVEKAEGHPLHTSVPN
eukprot:Blabericola_migrator_1__3412@NODE_2001_length_3440_cov_34_310703_g760_i2_p4_GENE_NODE_2001_length_3440_cov_34_310703_g760_i2NODE_2001_length_3440_cov_34_310703_g760_i2_p4_ORF_typecomplete_len101_score14_05_NODE_2001_length_3440_cov_34_310703_g760_i230333335